MPVNGSLISVSDEDRARGWTEVEISTRSGRRGSVRVHQLPLKDFIQASQLSPADATARLVALAIREPSEVVAELDEVSLVRIAAALATLTHGDEAAGQMIEQAAQQTLDKMRTGIPGGTEPQNKESAEVKDE